MSNNYIYPLSSPAATLAEAGGKGASLAKISAAGFPVPMGFIVTTRAYQRFVQENRLQAEILRALEPVDLARPSTLETASRDIQEKFLAAAIPPEIAGAVIGAYNALPGQNPPVGGRALMGPPTPVAVRSSATAEDLPEASFAGQQETFLNVTGAEAVLEATRKCWASLWTARAIGYRARQAISPDEVALAVVVQILVPADAAGILFTANPVNGRRDQTVISASWGLGEAVVGGAVTPDTLILEKASGQVVSRETAGKEVMTVRTVGGTREQAVPDNLRDAPVLDDRQAAELNQLGVQIEALYGMPVDIEWAWAEGRFFILQARPVTALQAPGAEAPLEWTLPDPQAQYMRASICELMPDPVSPLFASLGMAAIEEGLNTMAKDLLAMPVGSLSGFMLVINGYAYQKASFTRRQWWLMLSRMLPSVPRMLKEGVTYWQSVALPRYAQAAARWQAQLLPDQPPAEIWAGVNEIMAAFAHHLGALMASTMGPTAGSEGVFTQVYNRWVRQDGDPAAPAFLMGFDSIPMRAEKALYDLACWCKEQVSLAAYLGGTPAAEITRQLATTFAPAEVLQGEWEGFARRFHHYLEAYGYSIYDMDFAKPLPLDDPEPLLESLKLFAAGGGKNPYERQQRYAEQRENAVEAARARLKGFKRWAFEKALKWAQSQAPLREDGIAEIGLGYPALRGMLLELGRRFAGAGAIRQAEDIFWLEKAEVEAGVAALEHGEALVNAAGRVQDRKALWARQKRLTPPAQLPPGKKYLGMNVEGLLAVGETEQAGSTIKGVAASPGQVKGTARVLHGPEDFDQLQPGDVLVAVITTPAWTPLFAMASGIVTDIGGPLSHGSIVAREYGIPAVLGTGVATRRIRSGQQIMVDGTAGLVTLSSAEPGNGRPPA